MGSPPLIVMMAIPFSLVGILPAHGLMGAFFTATSMIGFIAGAGIVVRNSIILVDFIELRLGMGEPLEKAVVDAGAVRFASTGRSGGLIAGPVDVGPQGSLVAPAIAPRGDGTFALLAADATGGGIDALTVDGATGHVDGHATLASDAASFGGGLAADASGVDALWIDRHSDTTGIRLARLGGAVDQPDGDRLVATRAVPIAAGSALRFGTRLLAWTESDGEVAALRVQTFLARFDCGSAAPPGAPNAGRGAPPPAPLAPLAPAACGDRFVAPGGTETVGGGRSTAQPLAAATHALGL